MGRVFCGAVRGGADGRRFPRVCRVCSAWIPACAGMSGGGRAGTTARADGAAGRRAVRPSRPRSARHLRMRRLETGSTSGGLSSGVHLRHVRPGRSPRTPDFLMLRWPARMRRPSKHAMTPRWRVLPGRRGAEIGPRVKPEDDGGGADDGRGTSGRSPPRGVTLRRPAPRTAAARHPTHRRFAPVPPLRSREEGWAGHRRSRKHLLRWRGLRCRSAAFSETQRDRTSCATTPGYAGIVTETRRPPIGLWSRRMSPPWLRATSRAIDSPSPVPLSSRLRAWSPR